MLSVHDVLTEWQAGDITTSRAMRMTGASDVMELYAFASQSGVELRAGLLPREEEQARHATGLIRQLPRKEGRMSWAGPIDISVSLTGRARCGSTIFIANAVSLNDTKKSGDR